MGTKLLNELQIATFGIISTIFIYYKFITKEVMLNEEIDEEEIDEEEIDEEEIDEKVDKKVIVNFYLFKY